MSEKNTLSKLPVKSLNAYLQNTIKMADEESEEIQSETEKGDFDFNSNEQHLTNN